MEQCKIVNMYDLNETIAKEYMETAEYPWELLDGLSDYIKRLGDTLDPEKYEKRGTRIRFQIVPIVSSRQDFILENQVKKARFMTVIRISESTHILAS